jgi:bloom syndrome protein
MTKAVCVAAPDPDYPLSTNVSSPIQARDQRRRRQAGTGGGGHVLHSNGYEKDGFVTSDGDDGQVEESDEEEAFEPIREAGRPQRIRKRELGPPITTDEKMDRLNEAHRMVVEDFLVRARKECQKVRVRATTDGIFES